MCSGFERIEQRRRQPCRIIEISVEAPLPPRHRPTDPPMGKRIIQEKCERLFRCRPIGWDAEGRRRIEECGDHHGVPTGQNIFVTLRFGALVASRQQPHSGGLED